MQATLTIVRIVTWHLKAGVVDLKRKAIASQRLAKHVLAATNRNGIVNFGKHVPAAKVKYGKTQ
jgi:hypothetical protein